MTATGLQSPTTCPACHRENSACYLCEGQGAVEYALAVTFTDQDRARPALGHLVRRLDGTLSVLSVDYGDDELGACPLTGTMGVYWSPDGDTPQVSGGPHPAMPIATLRPTGRLHPLRCWRWKDRPRAGGGEPYDRDVPLWQEVAA